MASNGDDLVGCNATCKNDSFLAAGTSARRPKTNEINTRQLSFAPLGHLSQRGSSLGPEVPAVLPSIKGLRGPFVNSRCFRQVQKPGQSRRYPWRYLEQTRRRLRYRSLVCDLSSRIVADSGPGKQLSAMDPFMDHPDLTRVPRCRKCKSITKKTHTKPDNPNGNGGRPYFKCMSCMTFSCFGDMRGISDRNPACECSAHRVSRAVLGRKWEERIEGRACYYRCAVGGCRFVKYGDTFKCPRDKLLRVSDVVKAGL